MNQTKKLIYCLFLFIVVFSFPAEGLTWGSLTHAYIAKQLGKEIENPQVLYGAASPDFFYDLSSQGYGYLSKQTHTATQKIKASAGKEGMKAFAFGFISHNETWGADRMAHNKGRTVKKGYVVTKAALLTPKLFPRLKAALDEAGVPNSFLMAQAVSSSISHKLLETAIDLQIRLHEDPGIGADFLNSVESIGEDVPGLLAHTYGNGLSKHLKITRGEADRTIREAEADFRELMTRYGELLAADDLSDLGPILEEGAELLSAALRSVTGKDVIIKSEVMQEFLELASYEIEGDYSAEISASISYLKKRKELTSYLKAILRNQ